MNGCEITGNFEANRKEEHILRSSFFKGVAEHLRNNKYLQKLPVDVEQKKKKKSNKNQPETARGGGKKQGPQASRSAVDNTWTRTRTDSSSSSFSNFSDIEMVKETYSSVAH